MNIEKLNMKLLKEAAENVNDTFQADIDLEQPPIYLLRDTINALMPLSKEEQQSLGEVVFDFAANAIEVCKMPKLNQIRDAANEAIEKLEMAAKKKEEPKAGKKDAKKDVKKELEAMNMKLLRARAKEAGVLRINSFQKTDLIKEILKNEGGAPAEEEKKPHVLPVNDEEAPTPTKEEAAPAPAPEKAKGKGKKKPKERAGNKVLDITNLVMANPLKTQNEIAEMLNAAGVGFSLATLNFEYRAVHRFIPVAKEMGLWKGE